MYVLISFSFKLIVNLPFSKKRRRLLAAFIARIFRFFDIFFGVEKCHKKLTLFPLMILSAGDAICRFVFIHF